MEDTEELILLLRFAVSEHYFYRYYAQHHYKSTEEIVLTAKAMDFIEGLVR
jgi:hypothetical protein